MKRKGMFFLLQFLLLSAASPATSTPTELLRGFSAAPDPSISSAQPLLFNSDSVSEFSLAFLRLPGSGLALAVVHSPSGQPVWLAAPGRPARWSKHTQLLFNGSLVLSGSEALWSTHTDGKSLVLRGGNLQVLAGDGAVLWQSFDFPSDTLLANQNFTEAMTLRSPNGLYSMRLAGDYLGLYAEFESGPSQLYWKRTALQAKAQIVDGLGPIYARVDPDGFLGIYQTEKAPVDIIAFSSYYRAVNGTRRLRMESDGNLRAYFWNSGAWVPDFSAIHEPCGLPSECGPYGLCHPSAGCTCLDDRVTYGPTGCAATESDDFCGKGGGSFQLVRRTDVDLQYKKLLPAEAAATAEQCGERCLQNCSCWAAVFTNSTGLCYTVDFPVRTVVASAEEGKAGFFKVRKREKEVGFQEGVVRGLIFGAAALVIAAGLAGYSLWRWRRQRKLDGLLVQEGLRPGPYRDLKESEGDVELSKR